ncbi:hypothetical protein [Ruegeria sp. HKCCA5763]|uniref:hypothetical protein n=1 Tax=Ruegeria sp. HKCCA5763 TaxID=2682987 RepID=UPI001489E586|nr:hypothetical protein [Ruegeria sp. HKCCA5763]
MNQSVKSEISTRDRADDCSAPLYNWLIFSGVLTVAAWFARIPIEQVVSLHTLAGHPTPYLIFDRIWLLNLVTPVASVIISLFFLLPGLILALAFRQTRDLPRWILAGLVLSIFSLCGTAILWHQITGDVLKGDAYFIMVTAVLAVNCGIYAWRGARGQAGHFALAGHRGDIFAALILAVLVLVTMSAKFYWENFSSDGVGVLNFVRNFIHTDWPFWSKEAGAIQVAPGVTSYFTVLPASWFQRLLGENEFAMRVPHVLYAGLLYIVVLGLIRTGRDAVIGALDHALIIAVFLVYTLSIIYSGGYNPYFGDSPMPAVRETLVMVLFLGYVYLVVTNQMSAAFILGILAYMSLPTGGLWMLLVLIAFFLVWRPRDWTRIGWMFGLLVLCAAIGTVGPVLITAAGLPVPGGEFDLKGIVNRLRYVTFWEPARLAYLIVPAGILPALSMVFWRRQDQLSHLLVLVTAAFFLFFYFQGYRVLLHHFIPVMLTPLIVMWRYDWLSVPRHFWPSRLAIAAGIIAAFFVSFPAKPGLHQFSREVGAHIQLKGERFEGYQVEALATFHDIFARVFPIQYKDAEAEQNYFGGPLVWLHYSVQPKAEDQTITYLLQPESDPAPEDARAHDSHGGYVLYILDEDRYQTHLNTTFTTRFSAPAYHVSRDEIFGKGARRGERFVIDLVAIARSVLGLQSPS